MELPGIASRIDAALQQFQQCQTGQAFLTRCLALIGQVEEWKYSTGPLYDLPPYQMQLMGFSGGKPLKKPFADLTAARAGGAYASGFIAGQHVLSFDPAENLKLSPQVTQYDREGDLTRATITRQPDLAVPALAKPARSDSAKRPGSTNGGACTSASAAAAPSRCTSTATTTHSGRGTCTCSRRGIRCSPTTNCTTTTPAI